MTLPDYNLTEHIEEDDELPTFKEMALLLGGYDNLVDIMDAKTMFNPSIKVWDLQKQICDEHIGG